jgi:hypothetical protein
MTDGIGLLEESQIERARAAMPPTIRCVKCGGLKPREHFRWQISRYGKPSMHRQCVDCDRARQRKYKTSDEGYMERNRKRLREYYSSLSPEQRAEFIKKCTARRRARMMGDPEYAAIEREKARNKVAIARAHNPKRRERDAEYARNRRARVEGLSNRERVSMNEARQKDVVKFIVRGAKHRSIKNGHEFDLTLEWARERWTGHCELSGLPFDWSRPKLHEFSPSIDRVDASKGYTQDNCRFILQAINAFKGSWSDETMFMIARALLGRK